MEEIKLHQFAEKLDLQTYSPRSIKTYCDDVARFFTWLSEHGGLQSLDEVNERHLSAYHAHLQYGKTVKGTYLATTTLHHRLFAVKLFYRIMYQERLIRHDYAHLITPPRQKRRLPKNIPGERDISAMLDSVKPTTLLDIRNRAILELLYATGIRNMELRLLTLEDLNLPERTLFIHGKGEKDRVVPLGSWVVPYLTEYLEVVRPKLLRGKKSDLLFVTKSGNEIPAENLCYIVRTRAQAAGISQRLNPHTCGTPARPTCCGAEPISATYRSCSDMPNCQRRRYIRMSTSRCLKRRIDSFILERRQATMQVEFTDFLRAIRPRYAAETWKGKRWQLMSFEMWLLRNKHRFSELAQADIENFIIGMKCCRAHKVNLIATLRQFYDFHDTTPNPAAAVTIRSERGRRLYKIPSAREITSRIAALTSQDALIELRDRFMVEFAYGSGLRRGEIMKIDVDDIDRTERVACVTGKGDRSRMVPLTEKCCGMLREYLSIRKAAHGPVFVNLQTGRRLSCNHISKVFRRRLGYKTHAMRHACATHLLQNGCDVRIVQELLGHQKIDTTGIYTHLKTGDLRRAVERNHPRNKIPET